MSCPYLWVLDHNLSCTTPLPFPPIDHHRVNMPKITPVDHQQPKHISTNNKLLSNNLFPTTWPSISILTQIVMAIFYTTMTTCVGFCRFNLADFLKWMNHAYLMQLQNRARQLLCNHTTKLISRDCFMGDHATPMGLPPRPNPRWAMVNDYGEPGYMNMVQQGGFPVSRVVISGNLGEDCGNLKK